MEWEYKLLGDGFGGMFLARGKSGFTATYRTTLHLTGVRFIPCNTELHPNIAIAM